MGIIESKDAQGRRRFAVRKRWPDGLEINRFVNNRTLAKDLLVKIENSIATGTWRKLREELRHGVEKEVTIKQFWGRFRDEYCIPRMTSWKRYRQSFMFINEIIGDIPLKEFTRKHLHGYIKSRKGKVSNSTINKDIAAIKKMFSYAFDVEAIETNPLVRFKILPVQETALRVMTDDEFDRLIEAMPTREMQAFVAVTGETGLRKSEALNLTWADVDFQRERIIVERTKGKRVRYVPLSERALNKISELPRYIGNEYIFIWETGQGKGRQIKSPIKQFRHGRKAADLEWVTIHGLRHYCITSWIQNGADVRSVQGKAGHSTIQTTMRYAHYVETHADKAIREAQERRERSRKNDKNEMSGGKTGDENLNEVLRSNRG